KIMRAAMGIGPVHAFDSALRSALIEAFPQLQDIELIDYKVRIMPPAESQRGTEAITRVLLESTDGQGNRWTTVGVSSNVIDASAMALFDSYAYRLYKEQQ
ncbi:MAG: citramalate synthase, partial [Endozoicomonadaceae bacterium]|nr:citramalate synthase [Endozoicomonadaceae bacterium]